MPRYNKSGNVNLVGEINKELERIAESLEGLLSREGETPNYMLGNIDMNSKQVINLGEPSTPSSAVRVQDIGTLTQEVEVLMPSTYFNVLDYGAVGDNSTDNATAFADTVAAISAAGGGVFYVPKGTFRTSTKIDIVDNMTVLGEGMFLSTIKKSTGSANDELFIKPNPDDVINNFVVKGITLEGTWDETFREVDGSLIGARNIRNVIINDVQFLHGRGFGLNLNLCTNALVINNRFKYVCRDMCGVWNTPNTIVSNNFFLGNDDDCISLNSAGFDPINDVVKTKLLVTGNTLEDCGGIRCQSANTIIVSNNILQRNKGNAQIYIGAENSAGVNESNPQTVLVQGNMITDIIDRSFASNSTPTINLRVGIKLQFIEPTDTSDYIYYYNTTGSAGTLPVRVGSTVVVKDNIIKRTLPVVSNYSDWGFGEMFTRFSDAVFAPNGFTDPQITDDDMRARIVEFKGPTNNVTFEGNVFEHSSLEILEFQVANGGTITDDYHKNMVIKNNIFRHCHNRAMDLNGFTGTQQDITFKGNLFDLDPLFESSQRTAFGGWSGTSTNVAIYISGVSGIKIYENTFRNTSAPYIQGGASSTNYKARNVFVGEPDPGTNAGLYSVDNKGLGIFPPEIKDSPDRLIYEDSDPTSGTYGQLFAQPVTRVSGATNPSASFYFSGQFVPSDGGVASGGFTTLGHRRLTTGTGHVAGTDWEELKAGV